jgi:hypothetical protein
MARALISEPFSLQFGLVMGDTQAITGGSFGFPTAFEQSTSVRESRVEHNITECL